MSALEPFPQKIARTVEETSGTGSVGEESAVSLMCHFDEGDFLELRAGAMKELKMKFKKIALLYELCEKELGVDKMRGLLQEVEVKLGLQHVPSFTKGSSGASKISSVGIQDIEDLLMPLKPGSMKQMKKGNGKRSTQAVTGEASIPMAVQMPNSSKTANDQSKEEKISTLQSTSADFERKEGNAKLELGERRRTISNNNVNRKFLGKTNQRQKSGEGVGEPKETRKRKRTTGDSKVSTSKNGEGDEDSRISKEVINIPTASLLADLMPSSSKSKDPTKDPKEGGISSLQPALVGLEGNGGVVAAISEGTFPNKNLKQEEVTKGRKRNTNNGIVSCVTKGNTSKISTIGIHIIEGSSMPLKPGNVKQMKKDNRRRSSKATKPVWASPLDLTLPKISKAANEKSKEEEEEISDVQNSLAGLEKDASCSVNLGYRGNFLSKNANRKSSSIKNKPQKTVDGAKVPKVTTKRKGNIIDHEVPMTKDGEGDEYGSILKVVEKAFAGSSKAVPVPRSSKSKDSIEEAKEGGILFMQRTSAGLRLERDGGGASLVDGGSFTGKNVKKKSEIGRSNQRKHEGDIGEPEVTKKRKLQTSNDNETEVPAGKKDVGDEDDLADSQAEGELSPNVEDTPEKVLEQIQWRLRGGGTGESQLEFRIIVCRAIEVGSYKMRDYDADPPTVMLTPLGIILKLPHSTSKTRMVNLCIPKKNIFIIFANLLNDLDEKHPAISLKTDPIYATWIRDVLGMDGNPDDENTNYYCPQKGCYGQQTIHFFVESLSEIDKVFIKKEFTDILKEIDYRSANTK